MRADGINYDSESQGLLISKKKLKNKIIKTAETHKNLPRNSIKEDGLATCLNEQPTEHCA